MAFSRNSLAAAVAGTLSLAVLTGCPAAAPTGPVTPSAAPTTAPTESAAPTTAPVASQAPNANASPTPLQPTTLRGKVFDLEGATVSTGAKVTVKSLNPSNPFDSTVDVISGNYVVNNVPAGVQLEITASREGWTSRTRVETLLPLTSTQPNIVNFGAATATSTEDTEGNAYFISKYPEITSTEPTDNAEGVDPTKLTYKLTLSEPLDATNQRRFATAIRVFPANEFAVQEGDIATNFENTNQSGFSVADDAAYFVREGSLFQEDDATRATVTWDAAGQVATLTFNAPLLTGENDAARYQVGLVAPTGTDKIQDRENNQLGAAFGEAPNGAYPTAGDLLAYTFRERDLSIDSNATDAETRWQQTHNAVSTFRVASDNVDPQLTAVNVVRVGGLTRIQLTFSEPMGAFYGEGAFVQDTVTDLDNYRFAVAQNAADLSDVDLDSNSVTDLDGSADARNYGATSGERKQVFRLTASEEDITISPTDPRVVRIPLAPGFFSDSVSAIKARAEGVQDPAGNSITSGQADSQEKVGNI